MDLKELRLKNFRNYPFLHLNFSSKINFIVGDNGIGKTNILEAIAILANTKSFRATADSEIIKWGETFYHCSALVKDEENFLLEVGCEINFNKLRKRVKINEQPVTKGKDFFGKLIIVVFAPQDIDLIHGWPELRRKFFDKAWSKIDNSYLVALLDFKKALTARNKILKLWKTGEKKEQNQLDLWSEIFVQKSINLLKKRVDYLKRFKTFFKKYYLAISEEKFSPEIVYTSSLNSLEAALSNPVNFLKELQEIEKKEKLLGVTLKGPQRDDYLFCNPQKRKLVDYASQGQKRMTAISIKMAENKMIEEDKNCQALILVDDIFSELDVKRKDKMIQFLTQGNQIFFTMANFKEKELKPFGERKVFSITSPGQIIEL